MERLIEIKSVPIEIKMTVNHARLDYSRSKMDLNVSRDRGGLNLKSKPTRLKLDTFEARNSICPTAMRSIEQAAQKGDQKVYDIMSAYARQTDALRSSQIGDQLITQFSKESQQVNMDFAMQFLPSVPVNISCDDGELNMRYEADKLNFDWRMNEGKFEFTPGSVEFSVEQQPDVIIKYIGGPLYVPPSADPDYEPIDLMA